MSERSREPTVDYATLAEFLTAIGYPLRLELLEVLRFPHTLSEIRVHPHRREGGKATERPAARQTVQGHLDTLVKADLLRVERPEGGGRNAPSYVVNSLKLYELVEELRRLVVRYAGRGPPGEATGTLSPAAELEAEEGPRVVLVHGLYEGKSFPLDEASVREGRWVVGRRRDAAVSLEYDPFVSSENAALSEQDGAYAVTDLGSKNGTSVNWWRLPKGASRALRSGDVIGVGRSLLVFVPE